jgi:hypothetical protein
MGMVLNNIYDFHDLYAAYFILYLGVQGNL